MKIIHFSETQHSLDKQGALKIFIDNETILSISAPELLTASSESVNNSLRVMQVPPSVAQSISFSLEGESLFLSPQKEKELLVFLRQYVSGNNFIPFDIYEIEFLLERTLDAEKLKNFLEPLSYDLMVQDENTILIRKR